MDVRRSGSSSLERMVGILDLFSGVTSRWTVDQMYEHLGYTRSTLYRYLKVLTDAELLTSFPNVVYTLGPRIIELDYEIRRQDPLILASRPIMIALAKEVSGIALLCRFYRDKVLCVHQESSTSTIQSTFERGLARPLLRGAASRIILAYLPANKIQRLFDEQAGNFIAAGLGHSVIEVRSVLKRIRSAGWDQTSGQVTPGITGISAPIFDSCQNVLGSLSVSMPQKGFDPTSVPGIADRVKFCARVVSQALVQPGVSPAQSLGQMAT